ncbi:hypothetical protein TIFTF001_000677 [Ficus carica]|uniref:C3H1-type domain-containing protein n=1 Tax=Ficus carica TaxID=3494 RepID=A0AA87ZBQ2_FICCA|nr:hypothetical protein TIFTF001_000677 [Ficus carica]
MAASPTNDHSPTQTLNPSDPIPQPPTTAPTDGHDSTSEPPHPNGQPSDAAQGEKRKREEEEQAEQSQDQDRSSHPLWKTSLCSFFRRQSGSCSHGASCRYAHGEDELRPRPDNSWDPTSERAKKLTKLFEVGDKCAPNDDVMMTEDVVTDEDGEDGDGAVSDPGLSKCLGVPFKFAKKKKGMTVGFVSFESADQLKSSVEELEGKYIGNKGIKAVDVIPRSFEKNTKPTMAVPSNAEKADKLAISGDAADVSESSNGTPDVDGNEENSTLNGSGSSGKSARDVVTPLAHMAYNDQLEHKKSSLMQILKRLTRNARKACPNGVSLPEWILKSREIGGLPCNFEGVLASPLVNGYRNKCEFSVGYSLQGKITVGFMLGNFREGVTAVEEPVDCPNVSTIACKCASIFQEFLQDSGLPVWNRFKNTGFWRQLTVREGRRPEKAVDSENSDANIAEVLLMVQVSTTGFDDALVTSEFEGLAQAFAAGAATSSPFLPLTALVVQDHQGISNVAPADAPLRSLTVPKVTCSTDSGADNIAEASIHDYISNLKFRISPTAFFQVNSLAAEKLYSLAGDWAGLGPDTLLFDVCCGTGTIGLTLAHRVGMVVGIEMNASAVSDAQRNAEINGIKNCRFVCAKAEDVMGSLLKEYMNGSQKQDEDRNITENGDKVSSTGEEKEIVMDNVQEPEGGSSHSVENVAEPGESSSHELESVKTGSNSLEDGKQEPESQLESNCTSENGNPSAQCFKNVVAIVDPPRGGLHPTVIKALRTHSHLRRLVYISCNPESLVANAIELCTPSAEKIEKGNKNNRGWRNMSAAGLARHRAKSMPVSESFRPVKSMAVDLFPHTVHCEMVMLLER